MSNTKTKITTIAILIIIIGQIAIITNSSHQQVLSIDNGDYINYNNTIIIVKPNITKLIITIYNITDNQINNTIIETGLYNTILDVKVRDNTLHILAYTKILDRKLIIIYKYNIIKNKIKKNVIDITDITNDSQIKSGIITNNNIMIILNKNIMIYNIINNTVNMISVIDYSRMYVDETSSGVYLVYITNENTSKIYYYSNENFTTFNITGIVLDIDDNEKYLSIHINNKSIIQNINGKEILYARGIISSICSSDYRIYYSLSYKGINVLNMLDLKDNKNYILLETNNIIIDINCIGKYLILVYSNRSIQAVDLDALIANAILLSDSEESRRDNLTVASVGNGTAASGDDVIAESVDDDKVVYLKISSVALIVVIVFLVYKIVVKGRRGVGL